jgi:hypothetical protein
MFVFVFIYFVVLCGLCEGLITRPKESYKVSKIEYETSGVRRPRSLTRTVEPLMMIMTKHTFYICISDDFESLLDAE